MTREEMIAEEIRKNKEIRRKKFTNSGTFQPGRKPAIPYGRPKGSKNKKNKKISKEVQYETEMACLNVILELRSRNVQTMSTKELLEYYRTIAKFAIAEKSSIDVKETQIRRIDVSFSDEFGTTEGTIDITPLEDRMIEDNEGDDVNE